MFERTDALRDGGWREVETASRFCNRPMVDHCNEAVEEKRVHTTQKVSFEEIIVYIFFGHEVA
jgi:hypothetical protein